MRAKDKPNLERMRELINQLTEADIAYYKNDAPITARSPCITATAVSYSRKMPRLS